MNFAVVHRPDAGHERRERADDRHEAGDDDRLAAVLLVERVRRSRCFLLRNRDFPLNTFGPRYLPIRSSPCRRRSRRRTASRTPPRRSGLPSAAIAPAANSSESPGRNGVTTRPVSQKDDRRTGSRRSTAVLRDDLGQVLVEVQEEVDEPVDEVHATLRRPARRGRRTFSLYRARTGGPARFRGSMPRASSSATCHTRRPVVCAICSRQLNPSVTMEVSGDGRAHGGQQHPLPRRAGTRRSVRVRNRTRPPCRSSPNRAR